MTNEFDDLETECPHDAELTAFHNSHPNDGEEDRTLRIDGETWKWKEPVFRLTYRMGLDRGKRSRSK